jgi:Cof subfamily protein (haloacid dehalogenase superfamily)
LILYEVIVLIKMIVTDLDNTLLRRDKTISGYTVDVLRRVRERGTLLAFATARSLDGSREYRDLLNPDGDVVTGGCLVFVGGQLLRRCYMPMPQGAALLRELCENPFTESVSARSLDAAYSNIPREGRTFVDFKSEIPDKLLHCSCHIDDPAFMERLAARYPEFLILKDSTDSSFYDVNPKDATKLSGVKALAEHFGILLSEVAAFGDDYNDVEMLRGCGLGIAMRNAIEECKAAADEACGDCDEDGVAGWLEARLF